MAIFHSKLLVITKNPIKSHETTIFLWLSYGFTIAILTSPEATPLVSPVSPVSSVSPSHLDDPLGHLQLARLHGLDVVLHVRDRLDTRNGDVNT